MEVWIGGSLGESGRSDDRILGISGRRGRIRRSSHLIWSIIETGHFGMFMTGNVNDFPSMTNGYGLRGQ